MPSSNTVGAHTLPFCDLLTASSSHFVVSATDLDAFNTRHVLARNVYWGPGVGGGGQPFVERMELYIFAGRLFMWFLSSLVSAVKICCFNVVQIIMQSEEQHGNK